MKDDKKNIKSYIEKESGKPIYFSAGNYKIGENFPAGRYKVYNGSSNFVVYNGDDLRVNIILGSDSYSVSSYKYDFGDGETIEADSGFTAAKVK